MNDTVPVPPAVTTVVYLDPALTVMQGPPIIALQHARTHNQCCNVLSVVTIRESWILNWS